MTKVVKAAAIQETYDGEQQSFEDDLPTYIDAIARGMCDNVLRDIARAVFDRRDVLQGKEPGTSFRGPKPKKGMLPPRPGSNVMPSGASDATKDRYTDTQGTFISKVATVKEETAGSVLLIGNHYLRKDLLGLVIKVPQNINPAQIRGLRIRVKGVGDKRVMFEFVDLPPEGSSFRKMLDDPKKTEPFFLPHEVLRPILEGA